MLVEFDLPELPDCHAELSAYWLNYFFNGSPSQNMQVNALASTFLRLVEGAVAEYTLGEKHLREFWNTHTSLHLSAIHRAIAHFEGCITDMHRAINAYRRLRKHRENTPFQTILSAERPAFAKDAVAGQIRRMRDAIHHLDEMVLKGQIVEGQAIALKPDGPEIPHPDDQGQTIKTIDRLSIGDNEITFANLGAWLNEMILSAEKLSRFVPAGEGGDENGMDPVNMNDWPHKNMLHFAAGNGDLKKVRELVESGYDIDALDERLLFTPLHFAVIGGHIEVVKYLLSVGADVNAKGHENETLLGVALDNCSYEMAELLVRAGANPTIPN